MLQTLILARRQGPLVLVCIVVLGLVVGAYVRGHASGARAEGLRAAKLLAEKDQQLAERDQAALAELTAAILRERAAQQATAALEREHLEAELKRVQEQKVVTKIVKEYVNARTDLNRCSLDGDGLRLWNAANAGRADAPRTVKQRPRGTAGAVRGAARSGGR